MSRFNLAGILIGAAIAGTGLFLLSETGQRFRGAVTCRLLMAAVAVIVTARGLLPRTAVERHECGPGCSPVSRDDVDQEIPLPRRVRWQYAAAEPLGSEPGGEAERFAGLIFAYRNVRIPEPRYPAREEMGDS